MDAIDYLDIDVTIHGRCTWRLPDNVIILISGLLVGNTGGVVTTVLFSTFSRSLSSTCTCSRSYTSKISTSATGTTAFLFLVLSFLSTTDLRTTTFLFSM
jgi:hypothetical protein